MIIGMFERKEKGGRDYGQIRESQSASDFLQHRIIQVQRSLPD